MGLFSAIGKIVGAIGKIASAAAPFVAMVNPAWGAALAGIGKVATAISGAAGQDGSIQSMRQAASYQQAQNRAAESQANEKAANSLFADRAAANVAETAKAENAKADAGLFGKSGALFG